MKSLPKLSKSRFINGLQCHKRLWLEWLECFQRDTMDEVDSATQAIFDGGTKAGIAAQELRPGGILVCLDKAYSPTPRATPTILNCGLPGTLRQPLL